jgi:alpha-D-ribose 1-methylphosphonate 5-triphosphate synthase subunit PhnG
VDRLIFVENKGAAVTTDWSTVLTVNAGRGAAGLMCAEIANVGATALSDVQVQLRDHPNGAWYTFLSGTDWASTTLANMIFASTGLITLAAAAFGHVHVRLNAAFEVRVQVKVAAGSTSVDCRGTIARHLS